MTAITLYSLSTCSYCQAIKKMLTDLAVPHRAIEVDLLTGDEREAAVEALRAVNPQCSFPTTVIGERVVTGF
jgi:glutaredoxin